jgi:hypothetical protein
MSTKKPAAPPPYDPEAFYRVTLTRPLTVLGGLKLLPLDPHDIVGSLLNSIILEHGADVIHAADRR